MAVVLGISSGPHDSAACLLRDGKLLRAAAEERFTRRKQDGRFPEASIAYCLEAEGLTVEDIAVVAHGWRFAASSTETRRIAARAAEEAARSGASAAEHLLWTAERYDAVDRNVEQRVIHGLAKLGIPRAKLRMYDHHLCHAAAALYFCPYPGALDASAGAKGTCCITLDGRGDFSSGKVVVVGRTGKKDSIAEELEVLDSTSMFDSIGFLWAFVTAVLGFKPFRHEGKLTGLAARGTAERTLPIFESVMGLDEKSPGHWRIRTYWSGEALDNFQLYLAGLEDAPKDRRKLQDFKLYQQLADHSREDVAAGLQHYTEYLMGEYLQRNGFARQTICLSGGVFANVHLNMHLRTALPGVQRTFVFPSMGDGGICAGAAALAARECSGTSAVAAPKGIIFLGPEFDAERVRKAVHAAELPGTSVEELADAAAFARAVAEEIHAGRIVGLFWGAMEFGPRALGHRSLLARATDVSINDALNLRLRRSEFMPFAPVTLRARASQAYIGWDEADEEAGRHMTMCYEVTEAMRATCPAVVHVDGTARPQVIDERDGLYHDILVQYEALSGIHTFINTSFNMHEEPIVCTPEQALAAFRAGACDVLAAFPLLVRAQA
eukprot:TRINITY_DN22978_c0_g3_i1.p1 TRINITY_DN22978_c0_g3~~TRINITY_DN22978_c0_g3_i1.p1  ORF type:complete len:609 (-),score=136.42 TRINITY_DN22978_c0_g3_i1:209-2035(-)